MVTRGVSLRLNRLHKALERLRKYASMSLEELEERDLLPALEREVQVVVEALVNLGEHVIARMMWEAPRSYREVAVILREHGVLDSEQASKLAKLAGLRNVIVHMYAEVDYQLLHAYARSIIVDARRIASRILKFMEERGLDP